MEAFQVNICLGISIYCVDWKEKSLFWKLNLAKCVDKVDFPYVFLCWQRGSLGEKLGYTSSSSVVGSFPPFSVLCSSLCPLMDIRSQSSFCASQRHFSRRLGVWRCFHSQMLASGQPASMQLFQREMTYHRWLCIRGRPRTLSGHLRPCRFFFGHCIEQKVHSGSPVRCYGITWVNFWANPTLLFLIVSVELCPSHTKECFTGCRPCPPPWVDIRAVEIQAWILWAALLCSDAGSFFLVFLLSKLRDTVLTSRSGPTWWKMLLHLSSSPFEKNNLNFLWFSCLLSLSWHLFVYFLEKGLITWSGAEFTFQVHTLAAWGGEGRGQIGCPDMY